jgi:hypothetical protein
VLLSCLLYGAVEFAVEVGQRQYSLRRCSEGVRSLGPTFAVFVSTAGIGILVLPRLGWVTFPLLLLPLVAVQREFGRSVEARRAYEQTVEALGRLTERAGSAPPGYHARVAELSVAVGQQLELGAKELEQLRVAAKLHLVGAVSLGDPDTIRGTRLASAFLESTRILDGIDYLGPQARILARASADVEEAGSDSVEACLPSRILRLVSSYQTGEILPRFGGDAARMLPGDRAIVDALQRVTSGSGTTVSGF